VIPLPPGFTELDAMKIGTAGFTAALAIHRMEQNGLTPAKGTVVVTGATGGVGSLAINMLAGRGYTVAAVSGKPEANAYLRSLGATQILPRQSLDLGTKPLEGILWAAAVDNVGGDVLTWLTRTVDYWGSIASIGLAGGHQLQTTVMPFILRGINLLGINSSATPRDVRLEVWKRIATDLRPAKLDAISDKIVSFDDLPGQFDAYVKGSVVGRTIVRIRQ
jgi:acrylyl-CoA reductase (NADPH)